MMHKAWCSIEEVPYCFARSSIKFQGNTGWKIDNLNPIWVRLIGRSQLSNPWDLPCSFKKMYLEMSSAKWHSFCLSLNVLMGWHNFIYNCTTQRGAVSRCHFRWMLSIYFCLQCKSHYHMSIVGVKVITVFAYCQGHHLLNCLWNGLRGDGDPSSVFNSWHQPDYLVEPGH